ncbi:hypothetical protein F5X68DRAFT_212323 [Plectosphaerella plurivora]|uniref:Uncharacterized protein n=1 Tax=Plectosphaerella plurivora TaxID=936078 RepID=A0A9P8V733_9PEZI|nr:hypothetical protein F5X68DRAFT_212323 [Plectosphaerella plurivora]
MNTTCTSALSIDAAPFGAALYQRRSPSTLLSLDQPHRQAEVTSSPHRSITTPIGPCRRVHRSHAHTAAAMSVRATADRNAGNTSCRQSHLPACSNTSTPRDWSHSRNGYHGTIHELIPPTLRPGEHDGSSQLPPPIGDLTILSPNPLEDPEPPHPSAHNPPASAATPASWGAHPHTWSPSVTHNLCRILSNTPQGSMTGSACRV